MSGEPAHAWKASRVVTFTGPDGVRHSFPADEAPTGYSEACGTTARLLVVDLRSVVPCDPDGRTAMEGGRVRLEWRPELLPAVIGPDLRRLASESVPQGFALVADGVA